MCDYMIVLLLEYTCVYADHDYHAVRTYEEYVSTGKTERYKRCTKSTENYQKVVT